MGILPGVSKLARYLVLMVLALWGLASMHCRLEALPGLEFLQSCCFAEASSQAPSDCESDGCSEVENARYCAGDRTAAAPPPLLIPALPSGVVEAPLPACEPHPFVASKPPPELPRSWQFSWRAALAPRAPAFIG
jgi:hypothetical protein